MVVFRFGDKWSERIVTLRSIVVISFSHDILLASHDKTQDTFIKLHDDNKSLGLNLPELVSSQRF